MAFVVHVGAELHGVKDNLELRFPRGRPTLDEFVREVEATYGAEQAGKLPAGMAPEPFVIDQLRVYDECLGRWVDLTQQEQLHTYAQVYAFQPDTATRRDLRGLIPAPRVPQQNQFGAAQQYGQQQPQYGGGQCAGQGSLPGVDHGRQQHEQLKEAERHRQIAQHLNTQLQPTVGQGRSGSPFGYQPAPQQQYSQPAPQQQYGQPPAPSPQYQPPPSTGFARPPEAEVLREAERHRAIAAHLQEQLTQRPPEAAPQAPPQGYGYSAAPSAAALPGAADTARLAEEREREAQRHRAISEHLQSQLQQPPPQHAAAQPAYAPPPQQQSYATPPPQQQSYATPPPQQQSYAPPPQPSYAAHAPPQQYGQPPAASYAAAPAPGAYGQPPPAAQPGLDMQAQLRDQQKEAERHARIAQHLQQNLAPPQSHAAAGPPPTGSPSPGYGTPSPGYGTPPAGYSAPPQQTWQQPGSGAAEEVLREQERHRAVAQHINSQFQGGPRGW